jgi:hypothetical protein
VEQLLHLSGEIEPPGTQGTVRASLLELETMIDSLTQTAEVAFARAMATLYDASPNPDGDS